MKFYIQENIITTSEVEIPYLQELDELQIAFYLANRNATIEEILKCELNPPATISLEQAKANKIAELEEAFRKETQETGVIDTGLGYTVKGRYLDLMNVLTIQKSLELDNNSQQFIFDTDNNPHQLNLADINAIFQKFVAKGQELYLKLETLKETVNSSELIEDLQTINW